MRLRNLMVLPLGLLAAPLAAQAGAGFEGTVKMKVGDGSTTILWSIKGPMAMGSTSFNNPQTGPMDVTFVQDNNTHKSTFMIPLPDAFAPMIQQLSPGATGLKVVTDQKAAAATTSTGAPMPAPKKLGTKQTIAGMSCDDYEIQDSTKTRFCANNSLGTFVYPDLAGGMGGGRGGAAASGQRRAGGGGGMAGMMGNIDVPDWVGGLSGSGFPLKVWTPNGNVMMEVTAIEKKTISADVFAIPASYIDLNAMLGGFGGRGGGGGGR